jgi:hypothetical protein
METGLEGLAQVSGRGVNQQRHGARRAMCVNPGESPWEFR